jgi:cobalt-zinc-cadmium efflux system protein
MDHQHIQDLEDANQVFGLGIVLNISYVIVEAIFGFLSGSLALLADAGHNASDVLGLIFAWVANLLSQRPFNKTHTYGWRSFSILAALVNALIILVAVGGIAEEAVRRLANPQPGAANATVIWVALVGCGINLISAYLFRSGQAQDMNVRGAYIHMAADAGVSAGVAIAALVMSITGWNWLDPVVSLVIAAIIFWGTWGLLRDSFHLLISGVPRNIDIEQVIAYLAGLPGVENVHDLHIWGLSTREVALTAHIVKPRRRRSDDCQSNFRVERPF